jgi:enoyl-CoA hydratase
MTVSYASAGGVAIIDLDDGKANVLTSSVVAALDEALSRAESDREVRCVLVAGRPGYLSGGFDLREFANGPDATRDLVITGARLHLRLFTFPRPVVLAVTGHAVAAGAILALACDWNIGAEGPFRIGLPETAIKMALPSFALDLAAWRLDPRHLTRATLLATMYDPAGALEAGYLDEVVTADHVRDLALAKAEQLAATIHPVAFSLSRDRARGAVASRIAAQLTDDVTSLTTG